MRVEIDGIGAIENEVVQEEGPMASTGANGRREGWPPRTEQVQATEIAAELFVFSNTVRVRLRHSYAKRDAPAAPSP